MRIAQEVANLLRTVVEPMEAEISALRKEPESECAALQSALDKAVKIKGDMEIQVCVCVCMCVCW